MKYWKFVRYIDRESDVPIDGPFMRFEDAHDQAVKLNRRFGVVRIWKNPKGRFYIFEP